MKPVESRPLSRRAKKTVRGLASKAGRERQGLFLLEGRRAIEFALDRGVEFRLLIASDPAMEEVGRWRRDGKLEPRTPIYRASESEIVSLALTTTPQGVLAVGSTPAVSLSALAAETGDVTLLVDGVRDPGNLGTLLRTLVAVGGSTALCPKGAVDPYNPKSLRGAAGTTFALDIAVGMTISEAVEWCATRSIPIVALAAGAPSLFSAPLPDRPLALAVGNEALGLSSVVANRAALTVGLPMSGPVESLSVAVAGSVALYSLSYRLIRRGER